MRNASLAYIVLLREANAPRKKNEFQSFSDKTVRDLEKRETLIFRRATTELNETDFVFRNVAGPLEFLLALACFSRSSNILAFILRDRDNGDPANDFRMPPAIFSP